jgi:hypothetical protein
MYNDPTHYFWTNTNFKKYIYLLVLGYYYREATTFKSAFNTSLNGYQLPIVRMQWHGFISTREAKLEKIGFAAAGS